MHLVVFTFPNSEERRKEYFETPSRARVELAYRDYHPCSVGGAQEWWHGPDGGKATIDLIPEASEEAGPQQYSFWEVLLDNLEHRSQIQGMIGDPEDASAYLAFVVKRRPCGLNTALEDIKIACPEAAAALSTKYQSQIQPVS